MIILKLFGGLGNQMFQLATLKSLSLLKKTKIGVDISSFEKESSAEYTSRSFELERIFDLNEVSITTLKSYNYLLNNNLNSRIKKKLFNGSVFFENGLTYQPEVKSITKNAYLEGYFQSEKYFADFRKEILNLFNFKSKQSTKTMEAEKLICTTDAIAIHIRRGDYASNKHVNSVHGTLPLSYYLNALNHFDVKNAHLFFFSDDIQWVKDNFNFIAPKQATFVNWNTGDDSWQDMYLMSKCHHFIIANSSFSWWGAWLSTHSTKKVICPKTWFIDPIRNQQTKDLIPKNWIRL